MYVVEIYSACKWIILVNSWADHISGRKTQTINYYRYDADLIANKGTSTPHITLASHQRKGKNVQIM